MVIALPQRFLHVKHKHAWPLPRYQMSRSYMAVVLGVN